MSVPDKICGMMSASFFVSGVGGPPGRCSQANGLCPWPLFEMMIWPPDDECWMTRALPSTVVSSLEDVDFDEEVRLRCCEKSFN